MVHSNSTPPLSYVGLNGDPEGLVVDYWKAWSSASGNAITFVQAEWPETLEMVRDGRADIHGGFIIVKNVIGIWIFLIHFSQWMRRYTSVNPLVFIF